MESIQVLDHGYVKYIESWGKGEAGGFEKSQGARIFDDYERGIIEAARQSTQGSFRGWEKDEKLLGYMFQHQHSSPFEFAGMVIEVQAPIFVFREWHRHRTQSYNEMSARYTPLPDLYYVPDRERCLMTQEKNKQAQGKTGSALIDRDVIGWLNGLRRFYEQAEIFYQFGLNLGIPKELARVCMPVGHYTRMRASANLRNWLAFLTLRMHPDAQWEIRQFANVVGKIISESFPRTWKLFSENSQVAAD